MLGLPSNVRRQPTQQVLQILAHYLHELKRSQEHCQKVHKAYKQRCKQLQFKIQLQESTRETKIIEQKVKQQKLDNQKSEYLHQKKKQLQVLTKRYYLLKNSISRYNDSNSIQAIDKALFPKQESAQEIIKRKQYQIHLLQDQLNKAQQFFQPKYDTQHKLRNQFQILKINNKQLRRSVQQGKEWIQKFQKIKYFKLKQAQKRKAIIKKYEQIQQQVKLLRQKAVLCHKNYQKSFYALKTIPNQNNLDAKLLGQNLSVQLKQLLIKNQQLICLKQQKLKQLKDIKCKNQNLLNIQDLSNNKSGFNDQLEVDQYFRAKNYDSNLNQAINTVKKTQTIIRYDNFDQASTQRKKHNDWGIFSRIVDFFQCNPQIQQENSPNIEELTLQKIKMMRQQPFKNNQQPLMKQLHDHNQDQRSFTDERISLGFMKQSKNTAHKSLFDRFNLNDIYKKPVNK